MKRSPSKRSEERKNIPRVNGTSKICCVGGGDLRGGEQVGVA